ncbi:carboxymuconolactone decarboxylase family protein [Streptomyces antarcticus]|uniref:carboxymuconolactone decarboxylase family protein n=1 Tax=Streptomyces antarcticus TaxID=2996458 RepID=UPI00226FF4AB|nr:MULTISPECIES: carboxymuconolactone decarboxylase family protein [unclassified Streptomyces]MCY0942985.1 carboxymuconolactone decarboxylase family protein [Streptomyces sp. H34-AA3]MCY0952968.1 carboxymuconolactone decarboxylase family protein [Streptomyces sp. H27-S2]MCZ4083055.1 carboxymuconolactone decarboxylase family protein [Streptomyces sp. H34-S5]
MPHITIVSDLPGIRGLMSDHPDSAAPLNAVADTLLRGPSPLPSGERELIATYVSELNRTRFCSDTHGAAAAAQLDGGADLVKAVQHDVDSASLSPLLRALLWIAAEVQAQAAPVSDEAIAAARAEGATDGHLHDTVLIAAAFCMYNRYVSCLATALPAEPGYYEEAGRRITTHGYARAV